MAAQGPSPAAAARRPAPPPPPSHASYILSQVRSGLAHLLAAKALDRQTFGKVDELLSKAVLQQHDDAGRAELGGGSGESEEERLGKRNAWLRDTLRETSLLPTIVETAMSIAIPSAIMGSVQREAVVQLVERSQKSIADAITNPDTQRQMQGGAWSGAKGAHSGIRRGLNAAGQGMQELSQKRQEARQRAEEKKAEKREKKALKKELKAEREAVIKQRQAEMLSSGDSATGTQETARAPTVTTAAKGALSKPVGAKAGDIQDDSESDNDVDSDEDDELVEDTHAQGGAVASVTCGRVDNDDGYTMATTTFSPWPGLLLSSTIVAISDDDVPSVKDIDRIRFAQATALQDLSSQPPPRRVAPPPTRSSASTDETTAHQSSAPSYGSFMSNPAGPSTTAQRDARHVAAPTASPPPPTRYSHPLPPPPAPQSSSVQMGAVQSGQAPSPSPQSQQPPSVPPQAYSYQPPPPSSGGSSSQSPYPTSRTREPLRTEVRDVTDEKQKSWTRKLGL